MPISSCIYDHAFRFMHTPAYKLMHTHNHGTLFVFIFSQPGVSCWQLFSISCPLAHVLHTVPCSMPHTCCESHQAPHPYKLMHIRSCNQVRLHGNFSFWECTQFRQLCILLNLLFHFYKLYLFSFAIVYLLLQQLHILLAEVMRAGKLHQCLAQLVVIRRVLLQDAQDVLYIAVLLNV